MLLRKTLGPGRDEVTGELIVCTKALWGVGEVHTGFWWEELIGRDHLEDLGLDGRKILK
jgi:hypothetical protein